MEEDEEVAAAAAEENFCWTLLDIFGIFVKTMLSVGIDEILKSLSARGTYRGKSYFYRWKF